MRPSVTTEFNTVFETVMSIAEQVDPIKLNATLTATAQALTGLGERFGNSLTNANRILDDLNPRMPQIRADTQAVADLADVYANASPDLWDGLENAVTTARTLNDQRGNIDPHCWRPSASATPPPTASSAADRISCAPPRTCCRRPSCSTTTGP